MLRPRPQYREGQDIMEHSADRQAWHTEARRALSLGHVDGEQARTAGYFGTGHDQDSGGLTWKPLPHTLYHVTTNAPAVREHGLRSRDELTQKQGLGLGGGESDTVSFTDDPKVAEDIHRSLREFHGVVNGHKTIPQMYDEAKKGTSAGQPWDHFIHGVDYGGDANHPRLQAHLAGRKFQQGAATQEEMDATGEKGWEPHPLSGDGFKSPRGTMHTAWHRPMTESEHCEARAHFYKTWAAGREHAGGPQDPCFFDTDVHGFAKADPKRFGVLKFHPKEGAQGYQVRALGEWRTATGDAVDLAPEHRKEANWDAMGDQDWDEVYHDVPEHIHRGLGVHLPDDLHRFVHDDSQPTEARAKALLRHLHTPEARTNPCGDEHPHWDHRTGLGTSWSGDRSVSEQFAADNADRHTEKGNSDAIRDKDHRWGTTDDEDKDPVGKPGTAVVVTIHKPERDTIDEDGVNGDGSGMRYTFHGHSENEVPLHAGTMHQVHSVSWQPVIHWSHPDYATDREPKETTHTFEPGAHQYVEATRKVAWYESDYPDKRDAPHQGEFMPDTEAVKHEIDRLSGGSSPSERELREHWTNGTTPKHLYRAISESDFQRAKAQGYLDTHGEKNWVRPGTSPNAEGMVTSPHPWHLANTYLPAEGGRVVKIETHPEHGWRPHWHDRIPRWQTATHDTKVPWEHVIDHTAPIERRFNPDTWSVHDAVQMRGEGHEMALHTSPENYEYFKRGLPEAYHHLHPSHGKVTQR